MNFQQNRPKWKNLLSSKCPKCGFPIEHKKDSEKWECSLYDQNEGFFSCDFSINPTTLEQLKKKLKDKNYIYEVDRDNSEALNNL